MSSYPYEDRFPVIRAFPETGRPRDEILADVEWMGAQEDRSWNQGHCSGTMYCGDVDHYAFLNRVFAAFSHVNALQRDICPSVTKFEAEITAMTLDMLHGEAAEDACGSITGGGTDSILTAMLVYRDQARAERGITNPNIVMPTTAHPAFDKAGHLFGLEIRKAPIDPDTTLVDVDWVAEHIDTNTVALVGSAGNYPYGTIDDIAALSDLAVQHGIGLHVDGCLGGFILPWGQQLGYDVPVFDFRLPGVTTISADTHKYGYGLKGTSVLSYRSKALRQHAYFMTPEWVGGKYMSPGMAGSRSGGLIAATWASMVSLGKEGYLRYAKSIFETSFAMQDAVRAHPELLVMGRPTWCFSFRSDEFDIYHVNDCMKLRGWRFNGQQYPNAIHMAVTRPQTQEGVAEAFEKDLAEAVVYATENSDGTPDSAAIYGGIPGGMTSDVDEFIRDIMANMMDEQQGVPPAS